MKSSHPDNQEADALLTRVSKMSLPDRLRLAATFLEENRPMIARAIAARVADEIGLDITMYQRVVGAIQRSEGQREESGDVDS